MTDLSRLGEDLRAELGEAPAGWTERQRLRLRGLDLTPAAKRRPTILLAALAAGSLCAIGFYFWPAFFQESSVNQLKQADTSRTLGPASEAAMNREAVWVEAVAEPKEHRLEDGSLLRLQAGARGRFDQNKTLGARFDLHAGTVFFDIQKQQGEPFSVVVGEYRVVVVGTRFTTAYIPPRDLKVSVEEGVVQVQLLGRSAPISVDAGEMLEINGHEFSLRKEGDKAVVEERVVPDGPKKAPPAAISWQELYRKGKYQEACKDVRRQELDQPKTELGAADLIELANALRLCGDSSSALIILEDLRRRYPASSQAHEALFLIGRMSANQGQSGAAIAQLNQYLLVDAGGRFAAEALGRLIELHEAGGNGTQARVYAERYLQVAPQGPYRRLAESVVKKP